MCLPELRRSPVSYTAGSAMTAVFFLESIGRFKPHLIGLFMVLDRHKLTVCITGLLMAAVYANCIKLMEWEI